MLGHLMLFLRFYSGIDSRNLLLHVTLLAVAAFMCLALFGTEQAFAQPADSATDSVTPRIFQRGISESLSVASTFGAPEAPSHSFARTISDSVGVTSGFGPSQSVSARPATENSYRPANWQGPSQRLEERLIFKNLSNTKADTINGKSYSGGTPTSTFSEYDTGSMIVIGNPMDELESLLGDGNADDSDHSSEILSIVYAQTVEPSKTPAMLNSALYGAFGVGAIVVFAARRGPAVSASYKIKRAFFGQSDTGSWYAVRAVIIVFVAVAAIAIISSVEPLLGTAFADTNAAAAAYRSNTGTNGLNSPKYREWDPSTSTWSSEVELSSTGANVRDAKLLYSPTSSLRVIVTLNTNGDLHLYSCTSSCTTAGSWSGPTSIANVGSLSSSTPYRPYDIAFEQSSGKLVIAYDKSVTETNDFYWKTFDGSSLSSESGFNYVGNTTADNPEIRYFRVASKSGSNELAMILLDATNARSDAFIWDGSTFGNSTSVSSAVGTTSITGESIGISYERSSGAAVAFSGNGADATTIQRWISGSWSAITPSTINVDVTGNHVTFVTMKSDPVSTSNKIMICVVDSSSDGACAQEDGGTIGSWNIVTASTPSTSRRGIDFAWNASGSTGVVVFSETNSATVAQQWSGSSWGSVVTSTTSVGGTQVNDLFPQGGGGAQGTSKTATITGLTITTTGATNAKLIVKQIMRFGQATTVTPGTVSVTGAGASLTFGTGSASIVAGAGTKTQTLQTILPFSTTGAINAVSIGTISVALSLNPGVSAPSGTIASGSSPTAPPEVVGGTQTNTLTPSLGGTQTNTVTTTSTTAKTATATGITVTTGGATTGTITITQTVTLSNTATITGTPTVSQTGTPEAGLSLGTPTVTVLPTSSSSSKTITITQPFTTAGAVTGASIGTLSVSFTLGTARTASIATASGSPALTTTGYSSASSGVTATTTGAVSGTILLQQSMTFSGATNVTPGSVSITGTGAGLTLGTATPSIVSGAGTATQVLQISIPFSTTTAISSVSLGTVSVPLTLDTSQSITSVSIPSGYPTTLIDDGRWIVSAGNPTSADTAKSLWLTLNKAFKLTSSKYDGTNLSTLGLHTADTSVSTFEGMSIDFLKATTTSHSRSPSDTLTATDSAARTLIALRSISDSVTISDSAARVYLASRTASDSVALADSIATHVSRAVSGSVTIADTAARVLVSSRSASETVTLADTTTRALVASRSAEDSVTISDSITASKVFDRSISDSVTITDAAARTLISSRSTSDTATIADSIATTYIASRSASDTLALTDSITAEKTSLTRTASDTLTLNDSVSPRVSRSINDSVTVVDSISRSLAASRSAGDSVTIADSISAAPSRSASDSATVSDSIARAYVASRSASDSIAIADSISAATSRSIADNATITDSLSVSLTPSRSASDTVTLTDSISTSVSRSIVDSVGLADSAVAGNIFDRSVSDSVSVAEAATGLAISARSVSDSLAVTDAITKSVSRSVTDSLSITDSAVTSSARTMSETVAVGDSITMSVSRSVDDSLTVTDTVVAPPRDSIIDTVTLADAIAMSVSRSIAESLSVADAAIQELAVVVPETVTIADSVSAHITRSLADAVGITDVVNVGPSATMIESLAVADALSTHVTRSIGDSVTVGDSISAGGSMNISEPVTIGDAVSTHVTRSLADAAAVTDAIQAICSCHGGTNDVATITDAISMHITRSIADEIILTEIGEPGPFVPIFVDTIGITDAITGISINWNRSFDEGLTLAECGPYSCNHVLHLDETMSLSGEISPPPEATDAVTISDSIARSIAISAVPSAGDTVSISDSVTGRIEGVLVYNDTSLIGDMPSTELGGTYSYTGNAQDLVDQIIEFSIPINSTVVRSELPRDITVLRTYYIPVTPTTEIPGNDVIMSEMHAEVPAESNMFMRINFEDTPSLSDNDFLSTLDIEFTPAVSATNFALVVSLMDAPPAPNGVQSPTPSESIRPIYIDVKWVGDFPGVEDPSVQEYYQNPPTFTFAVNNEWVEENSADVDSNGVPLLKLWLLDEGTNTWEQITTIDRPDSDVDGTYTFVATLPHFSDYAITTNPASSSGGGGGGGIDRFAVNLVDALALTELSAGQAITIIEEPVGVEYVANLLDSVIVSSRPVAYNTFEILEDVDVLITVVDITPEISIPPSAIAELETVLTNNEDMPEEFTLHFWYNDSTGVRQFDLSMPVQLDSHESKVITIKIPFTEQGIFHVVAEARSLPDDELLESTQLIVTIPWLLLYLYVLILVAVAILGGSGLAIALYMTRNAAFIATRAGTGAAILIAARRHKPRVRVAGWEEGAEDDDYDLLVNVTLANGKEGWLAPGELAGSFEFEIINRSRSKQEFVLAHYLEDVAGIRAQERADVVKIGGHKKELRRDRVVLPSRGSYVLWVEARTQKGEVLSRDRVVVRSA